MKSLECNGYCGGKVLQEFVYINFSVDVINLIYYLKSILLVLNSSSKNVEVCRFVMQKD
jgi:hypothetical protein